MVPRAKNEAKDNKERQLPTTTIVITWDEMHPLEKGVSHVQLFFTK